MDFQSWGREGARGGGRGVKRDGLNTNGTKESVI